jgi:hypothetical protein
MYTCKRDLVVLVKRNNGFGKIDVPTLGKIKKIKSNGNLVVMLAEGKEIELAHEKRDAVKLFYRHYNKKGIKLDEISYIDEESHKSVEDWRGPRGLCRAYRDVGGQISQFVDDYIKLFGTRPERLG